MTFIYRGESISELKRKELFFSSMRLSSSKAFSFSWRNFEKSKFSLISCDSILNVPSSSEEDETFLWFVFNNISFVFITVSFSLFLMVWITVISLSSSKVNIFNAFAPAYKLLDNFFLFVEVLNEFKSTLAILPLS